MHVRRQHGKLEEQSEESANSLGMMYCFTRSKVLTLSCLM